MILEGTTLQVPSGAAKMLGLVRATYDCGFAAAQCGKPPAFREFQSIKRGYASGGGIASNTIYSLSGKAKPFRTVLRQSHATSLQSIEKYFASG